MTAPHCEHDRYLVNVMAYARVASQRIEQLERLLALSRPYVPRGSVTHRLVSCPLCKRRARLAPGADRCSSCVAAAIDQALGLHSEARPWAREHDRCVECGRTERPHAAHGYCDRCIGRSHYRSVA